MSELTIVRKNPRAYDVLRDFSHAIKREWTVITSANTDIDSDPAFSRGCDKGMPIAYILGVGPEANTMKILLGTDGSDYSKAAVEECCRMFAGRTDLEIKILAAFADAYAIASEPFVISEEFYQAATDAAYAQAESWTSEALEIFKARFHDTPLNIDTQIVNGDPGQQLVEVAKAWEADLIVVGSHGRGFWGRLLGSVSDGVTHHSPCSVLVVRKAA